MRISPVLWLVVCCVLLSGCASQPTPPDIGAALPAAEAAASPSPQPLPGTVPAGQPAPVVTSGPRTGNKIALTFDGDLTPDMLAQIRSGRVTSYANTRVVDVLEREHVAATFFVAGMFAEEYPDFMRRLAANPDFELANHSYQHRGFTASCYGLGQLTPDEMAADVARAFRVMETFGGRQTRFFRFPGLCHDETALAAVGALGVTVIDGDVISGDPFATDPTAIADAVLRQARPGSIVIMHCTDVTAPVTDKALPRILAGLRAQGLEFVTVSELLGGE